MDNNVILMGSNEPSDYLPKLIEAAADSVRRTGRVYVKDVSRCMDTRGVPVSTALSALARRKGWTFGTDPIGRYYTIETGGPDNDALIRAGVLDLSAAEFGELMDTLRGVKRADVNGRRIKKKTAYEAETPVYVEVLSTPTAQCMALQTAKHFARAAYDLRRAHGGVSMDYSSERGIKWGLDRLENALDGWREEYGDDLIMPETGFDYFGVSAVGEDYIAKRFRITKQEATGAIRAVIKNPLMKGRVLLTNQPTPMETFVVVDCEPQLPGIDPLFNFRFRAPKHAGLRSQV